MGAADSRGRHQKMRWTLGQLELSWTLRLEPRPVSPHTQPEGWKGPGLRPPDIAGSGGPRPGRELNPRPHPRARCGGFSWCGAAAPGLVSTGSTVAARGLVALWYVGSSQIRGQTHVSCVGRWILYH